MSAELLNRPVRAAQGSADSASKKQDLPTKDRLVDLHWKRVLDFGVALVLLVLLSPIILIAALLVKLTSRGPAFYSQIRMGLDEKPFWIYKLRSMVQDSERNGAQWSKPGDSRVTFLGKILRRTHLDELPQLWNVLRGDMSLVGPRPERPEFVPALAQEIPQYRERMKARPGVTGLAQVQLPPDTDLDSVRRKLTCDLYYVENAGLWLDIKLILATALKVICVPTKWRCRILGIPSGEDIPGLCEVAKSEENLGSKREESTAVPRAQSV